MINMTKQEQEEFAQKYFLAWWDAVIDNMAEVKDIPQGTPPCLRPVGIIRRYPVGCKLDVAEKLWYNIIRK